MPGVPYTPEENDLILRLHNEGKSLPDIRGQIKMQFGVTRTFDALQKKIRRMEGEECANAPPSHASPIVSDAAKDMEIAALRAQLSAAQIKPTLQQPFVRSEWDEDEEQQQDITKLWQQAEADCEKKINKLKKASQFSAQFDNQPIAISFISDQHIAPGCPVAMKRMREDAELIARTPRLFAVLNGDGIDNHIKHRAAILAARSNPDDQWRLFDYYLQIFHESILVVTSGNHDAWSIGFAGTDILRRIAEQNKVRYAQHEARLTLTVGKQDYKIAMRHQYRFNSSINQTHAVKQFFRYGEDDFDIGCVSHHHEVAVEYFVARGQVRVALRPGSYQISSSYSAEYGYNASIPACPTVILFPEERRLWAFHDVREAVGVLGLLLGKR